MPAADLSPKLFMLDKNKLDLINPETKKLWRKYEIDMSLRELSPKTIEGYKSDLQQWWCYIFDNQDNKSVTELTDSDIEEFLYYCKEHGNNSRRMRRRTSSIAAFYKFLRKKRYIDENPMEFVDRPTKDVDVITQTFLTREQVEVLRAALIKQYDEATTVYSKHLALQYKVYAFFSLSTMARVTAISTVQWKQINFEDREIDGVIEKEGYEVTLYFSEKVREYLVELIKFREKNKIDDGGYVFVARYRGGFKPVTKNTLETWCKNIGILIGIPTLHAHDFRHSGSQLMMLNGASVEDISTLLNHKGTDVTIKHYLRVDKRKVHEAGDKYGL